jgi:hypothetical protein
MSVKVHRRPSTVYPGDVNVSVEMPQHPSGGGPEADPLPSLREVLLAEKVIRRYLSPTPLVWSRRLSREIGADVRSSSRTSTPPTASK